MRSRERSIPWIFEIVRKLKFSKSKKVKETVRRELPYGIARHTGEMVDGFGSYIPKGVEFFNRDYGTVFLLSPDHPLYANLEKAKNIPELANQQIDEYDGGGMKVWLYGDGCSPWASESDFYHYKERVQKVLDVC